MFKLEKKEITNRIDKKTAVANILDKAHDELVALAVENDTSVSEVVNQMIYFCLNRNQLTGYGKSQITKDIPND